MKTNLKGKDGKFKKLSLNERIRRELVKNDNVAEVAKKLNVRYQRVRNVKSAWNLAIVPFVEKTEA
jgi:DNA-directed RNA polymerase specialized sigma subunit